MAITKVAEKSGFLEGDFSSEEIALPSVGSLLPGDVVVIAAASDAGPLTGNNPSVSGYTQVYMAGGNSPGAWVYYKVLTSPVDTSVTILQHNLRRIAYVIQIWRGVDATTPIDAAITTASGTNGSLSGSEYRFNTPSNTTNTDKALSIVCFFLDDDDAAAVVGAPTGYDADLISSDTGQSSSTNGATVAMASMTVASAGLVSPSYFTTEAPRTDEYITAHFALRAAPGPGGVDVELGQVTESDSVLEISKDVTRVLDIINETEEVLEATIFNVHYTEVGMAEEVDEALTPLSIFKDQNITVSLLTEIDSPLSIVPTQRPIGDLFEAYWYDHIIRARRRNV